MNNDQRIAGFTLIELMITVVILAILVGIAYPAYTKWVTASRRTDAQAALMQLANEEERFFTECGHYAQTLTGTGAGAVRKCGTSGASPAFSDSKINFPTTSPDNHYALSVQAGNLAATCGDITCGYTVIADPNAAGTTGRQKNDGKFRIDSTGVKQWDKKNDGSYSAKWTDK